MDVILFVIMMLFGAIPCALLGYLIRFRGKTSLIAGYDGEAVKNPKLLADRIGNILFMTSSLILVLYLDIEYHAGVSTIGWVVTALLLIGPVLLAFRAVRLDAKDL